MSQATFFVLQNSNTKISFANFFTYKVQKHINKTFVMVYNLDITLILSFKKKGGEQNGCKYAREGNTDS